MKKKSSCKKAPQIYTTNLITLDRKCFSRRYFLARNSVGNGSVPHMCCNSTLIVGGKLSGNYLENDLAEVEFIVIDIDLLFGGVAHPVEDDLTEVREVDQVVPISSC